MAKPFHHDLTSFLSLELDDAALAALPWKPMGEGVRIAKLAREGETGLVLYEIAADAPETAFRPHRHVGGEAYLVLEGTIEDEAGRYGKGAVVWMPPGSVHTPRGIGRTLVLVLWPSGVANA
jgi:anti-sigma factor ChrR (cupin superfamily)